MVKERGEEIRMDALEMSECKVRDLQSASNVRITCTHIGHRNMHTNIHAHTRTYVHTCGKS